MLLAEIADMTATVTVSRIETPQQAIDDKVAAERSRCIALVNKRIRRRKEGFQFDLVDIEELVNEMEGKK